MNACVQRPKRGDFGGRHRDEKNCSGEMHLLRIQDNGCLLTMSAAQASSITRRGKVGAGVGGLFYMMKNFTSHCSTCLFPLSAND